MGLVLVEVVVGVVVVREQVEEGRGFVAGQRRSSEATIQAR